jgi:FkbM family methyltransferase
MHPLLDRALTRLPALYGRLAGLRPHPNLEKIVFLRLVRRGDVVFDVGANTGYYTVLLARLAGPHGAVHAFEPVPATYARLAERVARAGAGGSVVLNLAALSDREGPVQLLVPGGDDGQAALVRHRTGSWRDAAVSTHPSAATTLDGYAARQRLSRLDFIKVDVEGAELAVLTGGLATLRRFRPFLHLEVCPDWTSSFGYEPARLVEVLAPLGYGSFHLVGDRLRPLADPRRELAAGALAGSANLLCAVPELHGRLLARLRRWRSPHPTGKGLEAAP